MKKIVIYISGIDGCGKTTQAKLLSRKLADMGYNVHYGWLRWEPSIKSLLNLLKRRSNCSILNSAPRQLCENIGHLKWNSFKHKLLSFQIIRSVWMFYACLDYYIQYKKNHALFRADIVIIDRYLDDFIIDQALNLKLPVTGLDLLYKMFFIRKFTRPDHTLIITISPEVGYERKQDGTSLEHLKERCHYYDALSYLNGSMSFDGMLGIEEVNMHIISYLSKYLMEFNRHG